MNMAWKMLYKVEPFRTWRLYVRVDYTVDVQELSKSGSWKVVKTFPCDSMEESLEIVSSLLDKMSKALKKAKLSSQKQEHSPQEKLIGSFNDWN